MADSFLTLNDLIKINNQNLADRKITDLLNDAPTIRILAADDVPGTVHSYLKETGAPVVGFRNVNDGRDNSKSADTQVDVSLKIGDGSCAVDYALAQGYKDGPQAYVAREMMRHLRQLLFKFEFQVFNGNIGDANGFVGLADSLLLGHSMVINGTGSTAATGSSVYAIRSTGDLNDVVALTGKHGEISIGETTVIEKTGANGKYPAYYTPINAWLGLQVGGLRSVGRIANLTTQTGKGLTDALLAQLLAKFPASAPPTHWSMNRRSLFQLQASRTATNATGAPAPIPEEAFKIPIIVTDAITETESILT